MFARQNLPACFLWQWPTFKPCKLWCVSKIPSRIPLFLDQQGNVVSTTGVLGPPCVPGADSCSAAPMSVIRGALPSEVSSDRVLALWHTHGAGANVQGFNLFSPADVRSTNVVMPYDYPNYVGTFLFTPRGEMLFLPPGYAPSDRHSQGILLGTVPVR